jgi:hypothetical protein
MPYLGGWLPSSLANMGGRNSVAGLGLRNAIPGRLASIIAGKHGRKELRGRIHLIVSFSLLFNVSSLFLTSSFHVNLKRGERGMKISKTYFRKKKCSDRFNVADPGSGIRCLFDSGSGLGFFPDPKPIFW